MSSNKIVLICLLILVGCSSDEPEKKESNEFSKYVELFSAEAKSRGITVDLSLISIFFVDETQTPGFCGLNISSTRIQIKTSCWQGLSDRDREILIFHELGHAVLGRGHIYAMLSNKDKRSIMDPNARYNYSEQTIYKRIYYVDELFAVSTPEPAWARVSKSNPATLLNDSIKTTDSWAFINISPANHQGTITNQVFDSPGHSLLFDATPATAGGSFWRYNLDAASIPVGSTVTLTARIKTVNLKGTGIDLELLGYDASDNNLFNSYSAHITGNQDFTEYSFKIYYVPEGTKVLSIFFGMGGNSSGLAYVDNVKISTESP